MTSVLEFAGLASLGLIAAGALIALRCWAVLVFKEPWWKARRRGAQVRLFEELMEYDLLSVEKMPARHGAHNALKESTAWLARARWIQIHWLPELDYEMAAVLDSHSGLLAHLLKVSDGRRVPGGPLLRAVNCSMAYQWARLRYLASLERLAAACTDVSDDVARLEREPTEVPQAPLPFTGSVAVGFAQ